MKKKILCLCAKGENRSRYLANYLRRKGYSTRYGGLETNSITQKDVDWADVIVIVRKRLLSDFRKNFRFKGKLIMLDVTDSKRLIPESVAHLRSLPHDEFQKKWTRPQLRKAIAAFLPF